MFIGRDYPPFQDVAARLLGADLTALLQSGETITGVTGRLITISGTDALPGNHLPHPAQFSGAQVSQLVSFDDPAFMLVGNIYGLLLTATTSLGQTLVPWSRFQVVQGYGITGYAGGQPPASARSVSLTVAPLFYTLPLIEGGYVGHDFPPANQTERLLYGIDFAAALSPNEAITSATVSLFLLDGTDAAITASPIAYNSGIPSIAGSVVQQLIAWPGGGNLTANVYAATFTANTSFGQSLTAWSRIVVDQIG